MDKAIELKDFDILGIIRLKDVAEIGRYVTPIFDENGEITDFLSRSKEYYNVKSMTELSEERESLKSLLTREISKRNFVILENMLNCSAKVYFKKLENYIASNKDEEIGKEVEQAEKCLSEDVRNIIVILSGKGLIKLCENNILPTGFENAEKRFIEMDNKSWLYIFAKSLDPKALGENIEVVVPGYGGLYIGPFLKVIHGYSFTNILKSKYIGESFQLDKDLSIESLSSSSRPFEPGKRILMLDDNIGTGQTMQELKREFQNNGIQDIITGAIQYNWRNYYRVSTGDKRDIKRFEPDQFDLVTPINYAGNKLFKHAVDRLHSSGNEYLEYLKTKSYYKDNLTDLRGQIDRGILCARRCNLDLMPGYEYRLVSESYPPRKLLEIYGQSITRVSSPMSRRLIDRIMANLEELEMEQEDKSRDIDD